MCGIPSSFFSWDENVFRIHKNSGRRTKERSRSKIKVEWERDLCLPIITRREVYRTKVKIEWNHCVGGNGRSRAKTVWCSLSRIRRDGEKVWVCRGWIYRRSDSPAIYLSCHSIRRKALSFFNNTYIFMSKVLTEQALLVSNLKGNEVIEFKNNSYFLSNFRLKKKFVLASHELG